MSEEPHAIPSDYDTFTGDSRPDELTDQKLTALLHRSQIVIDGYLPRRPAWRPLDLDDSDIADALRDATCAQAAWFLANDEDGDSTGAVGQYNSMQIGSVSLQRTAGSGVQGANGPAGQAAEQRVSAEAVQILNNANLLTQRVAHW